MFMAIIKCKMCGGDIELSQDRTFGTCEYCGSTMTFPKVSDDQRAAAFNRGNHFRRIGEFDKALAVYERIVQEDDNDAEAHWCCALCRFGIEYVEDPASFEWLPTCHRASFDSFLEDVDYLAAVEYSDGITRRQYQKDAAKIAEVQRGILAASQNSEPYDVFICYKESDENGNRTRDSLLAQDIYYQFTDQGRKVFFSRITLEDMAGTQYEPYIFAALNSAKVMIVVGTKGEHMNAVWVKNEWSRFLTMMKKDRSKVLLPCYRDMDPYDMPEQLSVLQSYDMSKIGFIQDLIRGVAKVLDAQKKPEPVKETVVMQQTAASNNVAPLLKRAFMFLEDGDWSNADAYCERVLDIDPENGQAYLGKLMTELKVKKPEALRDCAQPFDDAKGYQKAYRYGDAMQKKLLTVSNDYIKERIKKSQQKKIYNAAYATYLALQKESGKQDAEIEKQCVDMIKELQHIPDYEDAGGLIEKYKELIYNHARMLMDGATSEAVLEKARSAFSLIPNFESFRDAKEQGKVCASRIGEIRLEKIYVNGCAYQDRKIFSKAQEYFSIAANYNYKDSAARVAQCKAEYDMQQKLAERERKEMERKNEERRQIEEAGEKQYRLMKQSWIEIETFLVMLSIVLLAISMGVSASLDEILAILFAGVWLEAGICGLTIFFTYLVLANRKSKRIWLVLSRVCSVIGMIVWCLLASTYLFNEEVIDGMWALAVFLTHLMAFVFSFAKKVVANTVPTPNDYED